MSPIIRFIALGFAMIAPQLCFGGLVPGGGDLENDLNNALRFDPSTPTNVIVAYKDPNVPLDRYIQVGYKTTNSNPIDITSIAWSKDNVTYNPFVPNDSVTGVVTGGVEKLSDIIDTGSPIGGTSTTPFFLKYTLPSGISPNGIVQSIFYANSNGAASGGKLIDQLNNNFINITRTHTAVPEPTSLMLGTAAGTAFYIRRRLRSKSART